MDSGASPDDIPESISGEEFEQLRKVAWDEKKELALERHNEMAGELEEEIVVKYYTVLETIQEDHRMRRLENVNCITRIEPGI